MATINGTSGADDLTNEATNGADTIYGYDPSSPTATQVGTGMFQPVFATAPVGDANRLFIAEKGVENTALVKVIDLQKPTAAAETILTLSSASGGNETGLLGLALHPEFAVQGSPHRGKLYVNYSVTAGYDQVIVEYVFNPDDLAVGPIAPPKTIMTIDCSSSNHRAGWMEFGPDKMLYIATGEDQVANNSQTILNQDGSVNLKGKILRIDVSRDSFPEDANNNYGIPTDNPTNFQNINGTFAPSAIWAVGLRNPWRCSFGPDGKLYIADVGDASFEEINIGTVGANYGWRATGGTRADGPQGNGYTDPAYYYPRTEGVSITGGYVYKGPGDFNGHYIYGDYGTGQIFAIDFRTANPAPVNITSRIAFPNNTPVGRWNLVSFGQDGQGNLYVLGKNGRVLRLDLNGSTADLGDTLDGAVGNDTLHGGGGNDVIHGGADDDQLYGDAGSDRLSGDLGMDMLAGGAGNDLYFVDGGDTIVETAGDSRDQVYASETFALQAGWEIEVLQTDDDDATNELNLTGNGFSQELIGNAGSNILNGNGGQDTLRGGIGNDTYVADVDDTITEAENAGTDTVETSAGAYTLGENLENLVLRPGGETGTGNELANTITGNDAANILDGRGGIDRLIGGDGNDTYVIDAAGDVIVEAAAKGTDTLVAKISYVLTNEISIETLKAAAGTAAINLTGNALGNRLSGNSGANRLDGGAGDDTVVLTGAYADYTFKRNANGSLEITDKRTGGDGTDTILNAEIFEFGDGRKYSEAGLFNTTPSGIKLNGDGVTENSSIDTPVGTLSLTDDPNDTHVFALVDDAGGRFAIDSRTGAITVANGVLLDYEQATQHTVKVRATDSLGEQTESEIVIKVQNSLNERATGSALSDKIVGGAGRDIFNGAAGDDILIGGLNRDVLTGGQGRYIFVFDDKETGSSKTKADYITDYSGRRGDRLDLKLVDADAKKKGDQKFSFIGTKEFTKAGQVRYEKTKKETYVYLNTDSDKAAEAVIKLKGSLDLQKGWFVL